MTRGWRLLGAILLVMVGASIAVGATGDTPDGVGVPALLFPADGSDEGADGAADRARSRLDDFLAGSGPSDSLALDQAEVRALVRERLDGRLPPGVSDLRVELRGPAAAVSARIRFDELETGGGASRELSQLLGDSTRVELRVEPSVAGPGTGRFTLRGVRAGGLGLPSSMLPFMLSQLGVEVEDPEEPSVTAPIPPGITGVEVGDGTLLLVRSPGS